MKLLLRISFLGTRYCGYQAQKDVPTVQQALTQAATALFGFPCDITGCSRTDSGVHANEFCVTVAKKGENSLCTTIPADRIPLAFVPHLPWDISVRSADWVPETFHPRYDVAYKEYVYLVYNTPVMDPFYFDRAWHYPRKLSHEAVSAMAQAAAHFVGKHDFSAFMATGSRVENTVRTVYDASVVADGDRITFRVSADGFLYNMVRIMMGTLIMVAEGKLRADQIPAVIGSGDRSLAGSTAPAKGLYLNRVVY